ncbi:patatin-like phospholipase family protein [Candidatus Omnitrophota bacterium]
MKKKFKVALALGGGGARGFAHIGVIKTLKLHSIPIDLVVGTSMGAIIGAIYCLNPDVEALKQRALGILSHQQIKKLESFFALSPEGSQRKFIIQKLLSKIKDICVWNLRAAKKWLVRTEPIAEVLKELFDNKKFSDTRIPLACVAVDLIKGTEVILNKGRILDAAVASSSIPGVFAPFRHDNQLLGDGGALASVPAKQARILGADFVIGVDLEDFNSQREVLNGLDAIFQSDLIKSHRLNKLNLKFCDWVIKPDIVNLSWSEFSRSSFCLNQGELAALRDINKIKDALLRKKKFYFIKKLFPRPKDRQYID